MKIKNALQKDYENIEIDSKTNILRKIVQRKLFISNVSIYSFIFCDKLMLYLAVFLANVIF